MDLLRREVRRTGRPIELKPREFRLLEFLLRHAGQVVTRTMLLEGVWDYHFDPQTNVIDVQSAVSGRRSTRASSRRCSTPCAARDTSCVSKAVSEPTAVRAQPARNRFFTTSTFRLALLYTVLFGVSVLALLALFYWSADRALERQTSEAIEAEIQALNERYRIAGITG